MVEMTRTDFVEYSKRLQFILSQKYKKRFRRRVFKMVGTNPFIEIGVKDWRKDLVPNELRVLIAKTLGFSPSDWSNVQYGNIRDTYITLHYAEWQKVLQAIGDSR